MSDPNDIWVELELCEHREEELIILTKLTEHIAELEEQVEVMIDPNYLKTVENIVVKQTKEIAELKSVIHTVRDLIRPTLDDWDDMVDSMLSKPLGEMPDE